MTKILFWLAILISAFFLRQAEHMPPGDALQYYDLAVVAYHEGRETHSFWLARKAAASEDPWAQEFFGRHYEEGAGTPKSLETAFYWYRLAAEQEQAQAQLNLAILYLKGFDVPMRLEDAARMTEKAADQSHHMAQYLLGQMYEIGFGVPQDYVAAAKWYRRSSEQYNHLAATALGRLLYQGWGIERDPAEAIRHFEEADYYEDNTARYYLQAIARNGPDSPIDDALALAQMPLGYMPTLISEAQERHRK